MNKRIDSKSLIMTGLFAALTAIGAFIKIPVPYVPFTLQFLFCAFSGILLGSKLGMLSQLLYVLIGLAGIPVFAQGGGISYIFQPSFGYIIGLIPAAYIMGKVSESFKTIDSKTAILSALSGIFVIYIFGVTYLYLIYSLYLKEPKSILWVIYRGALIFIAGDLMKSVIVALIACKVVPLLRKNKIL